MQVRYRSDKEIEGEAQHLIDQYAQAKQWRAASPIPIEKLIIFLDLRQEIHDLYNFRGVERDGQGDLLGALCFSTRTIHVHQGIDPEDHPGQEGRFNFTLGHEVGHWVLHRDEFISESKQQSLFSGEILTDIVCRQSDKAVRIEFQANRFASCLLLPRKLVTKVWRDRLGSNKTMTSEERERAIRVVARQFCTSVEATRIRVNELGLSGRLQPDLGV